MHFDPTFLSFFQGLSENNTKEWFQANRKTYEQSVKKPFQRFVQQLILRLQAFDPDIMVAPKDCIFRINRDVRFSKDKQPYKIHTSAVIAQGGKKSEMPGYYIQLGADTLWIGGGAYFLEKETLFRVRQEIAYEADRFLALVNEPKFTQHFGQLQGEENKILPTDFKQDRERVPQIAKKQFYFMAQLPPESVLRPDFEDLVLQYFEAGAALNAFLAVPIRGE